MKNLDMLGQKRSINVGTVISIALSNIRGRFQRYLIILGGIALTCGLIVIIRGYTVALKLVEDIQVNESILFYSTLVTYVCLGLVAVSVISTFFLSITERAEEIGLYRISGARSYEIFLLFEIESIIIGFVSLIIGYIVGLLLFFIDLNRTLQRLDFFDFVTSNPEITRFIVETFALLLPVILIIVFSASLIPIIIATRMEVIKTLKTYV